MYPIFTDVLPNTTQVICSFKPEAVRGTEPDYGLTVVPARPLRRQLQNFAVLKLRAGPHWSNDHWLMEWRSLQRIPATQKNYVLPQRHVQSKIAVGFNPENRHGRGSWHAIQPGSKILFKCSNFGMAPILRRGACRPWCRRSSLGKLDTIR